MKRIILIVCSVFILLTIIGTTLDEESLSRFVYMLPVTPADIQNNNLVVKSSDTTVSIRSFEDAEKWFDSRIEPNEYPIPSIDTLR